MPHRCGRMEIKMNNIKYKCISVASMTYAQKAADLLRRKGIDCYIIKQDVKNEYGCARCVKVKAVYAERAYEILKGGGVKMSGDIYDL